MRNVNEISKLLGAEGDALLTHVAKRAEAAA